MNRGRMIAVLGFACLVSSLAAVPAARALPLQCDKSPYDVDLAVVHANGVYTTFEEAVDNVQKLRAWIDRRLGQMPYAISYGLAYNEKKGVLESLQKLIRERKPMSKAQTVRLLAASPELPDDVRELMVQHAADLVQSGFGDDPSLDKQVQLYRDLLRTGRKVLVVAHSEGNMYANAAHARLFGGDMPEPGEDRFGIVGVATPTPAIEGWHPSQCPKLGCYTTLQDDLVIAGVAKLLPDSAPANVFTHAKMIGQDPHGHELIKAYLINAEACTQILDQVVWFVDAFGPLTYTPLGDSQISAYLTWDTGADLDLHVRERSGREHVYWGNADDGGHLGHLDLDDRDGDGPEHYYAECDIFEDGDLSFGVGYYEGQGPTTASLRIKVGSMVRTYTRKLAAPTGPASVSDPEPFVVAHMNRDMDAARDALAEQYDVVLGEVIPTP